MTSHSSRLLFVPAWHTSSYSHLFLKFSSFMHTFTHTSSYKLTGCCRHHKMPLQEVESAWLCITRSSANLTCLHLHHIYECKKAEPKFYKNTYINNTLYLYKILKSQDWVHFNYKTRQKITAPNKTSTSVPDTWKKFKIVKLPKKPTSTTLQSQIN